MAALQRSRRSAGLAGETTRHVTYDSYDNVVCNHVVILVGYSLFIGLDTVHLTSIQPTAGAIRNLALFMGMDRTHIHSDDASVVLKAFRRRMLRDSSDPHRLPSRTSDPSTRYVSYVFSFNNCNRISMGDLESSIFCEGKAHTQ